MTQNNDAISYLMENGLSADEISCYLNDGISMDELVTAVQGLISRREPVNSDTQSIKPADFSDAGNAEIFVREYSSYLIFVDSIRQQDTVENGEIAAVLVGDAVHLGRLWNQVDGFILQPENPVYRSQIFYRGQDNARIIGKAVGASITIV